MTTAYTIDLGPDIDYCPTGILEVDCRPIDGDDLQRWRMSMMAFTGSASTLPYPTQRDCAERYGANYYTWKSWEQRGVQTPFVAALLREWFRDPSIEFNHTDPAPIGYVKELGHLCGGYAAMAKELRVTAQGIKNWTQVGVAVQSGASAFVWWLKSEMDLKKRESVPSHKRKLSVAQVRDIRRRKEAGEHETAIARDHDVHRSTVRDVVAGRTYQWVDGGAA